MQRKRQRLCVSAYFYVCVGGGETFLWNSHFVQIKKAWAMRRVSWERGVGLFVVGRGGWHSTGWSRSLFPVSTEEGFLKELMNWKQSRGNGRGSRQGTGPFLAKGSALFSNPIESSSLKDGAGAVPRQRKKRMECGNRKMPLMVVSLNCLGGWDVTVWTVGHPSFFLSLPFFPSLSALFSHDKKIFS